MNDSQKKPGELLNHHTRSCHDEPKRKSGNLRYARSCVRPLLPRGVLDGEGIGCRFERSALFLITSGGITVAIYQRFTQFL